MRAWALWCAALPAAQDPMTAVYREILNRSSSFDHTDEALNAMFHAAASQVRAAALGGDPLGLVGRIVRRSRCAIGPSEHDTRPGSEIARIGFWHQS